MQYLINNINDFEKMCFKVRQEKYQNRLYTLNLEICLQQVNKMHVRCIHEVYFQPKMFETIGFHHQGRYNISACLYYINSITKQKTFGYPITYIKNKGKQSLKQIQLLNKKVQKSFQYKTSKFDVSYNEQQLFFNTSCRFKLQIDHIFFENPEQLNQTIQVESQQFKSQKKKIIKQPLYLLIKLIKYNEQPNIDINLQEQKGMYSTQNIIKNAVEDIIKEDQIQKQNQQKEAKSKKKKSKKQKQVEEVSEVTLQIDINRTLESRQSFRQMYQQILFPEQHFFGKLYFLISHIKLGSILRPKSFTLLQFNPIRDSIISDSSVEYRQVQISNKKIQKSQMKTSQIRLARKQNEQQMDKQQINVMSIFQDIFPSACDLFQQLIRDQIIELNRVDKLLKKLVDQLEFQRIHNPKVKSMNKIYDQNAQAGQIKQNMTSSLSTSSSRNSSMSLFTNINNFDRRIEICIPEIKMTEEDLFQYFECQEREQLYLIIYDEHRRLHNLINYKWLNIVSIISQKQWDGIYYYNTIINFRETIQYITQNKVHPKLITTYKSENTSTNKQYLSRINFTPQLKYNFYVYKQLPDIYIKKSINKDIRKQSHTIISSSHILFILVHGFNGNQHDMNRIKSFLSYFSTPHFLVLKNISNNITQSLDNIGRVAAEQISQYLKTRTFIHRINFVGFSLGGVIIRACLPYLKKYHNIFNMLITLSSPHLGVKQINNCIVNTGLKLLNKIRKVKNIRQLMLDLNNTFHNEEQANQPQEGNQQQIIQENQISYLQKLAENPSIRSFRLAVFCGSLDDKYVPGYSSTLDYLGQDQKILVMQEALKSNISNLHQIYVKFNQSKKGSFWDKVTGRRVHINFLDDDCFLHFLIGHYFHLF